MNKVVQFSKLKVTVTFKRKTELHDISQSLSSSTEVHGKKAENPPKPSQKRRNPKLFFFKIRVFLGGFIEVFVLVFCWGFFRFT